MCQGQTSVIISVISKWLCCQIDFTSPILGAQGENLNFDPRKYLLTLNLNFCNNKFQSNFGLQAKLRNPTSNFSYCMKFQN